MVVMAVELLMIYRIEKNEHHARSFFRYKNKQIWVIRHSLIGNDNQTPVNENNIDKIITKGITIKPPLNKEIKNEGLNF